MEVTKIFRFEAAHSVKDAYTARCDRERGGIHGHSYIVELTLEGDVKEDGMVIDFSLLKEKFNHIFDAFDHTFIVNSEDEVMVALIPFISARYMIFPGNPTAEGMAEYFFRYINSVLSRVKDQTVYVSSVTVWETVTGKATIKKDNRRAGCYPPRLSISPAVYFGWTDIEFDTFSMAGGVRLNKIPLATSAEVVNILGSILPDHVIKILVANPSNCK